MADDFDEEDLESREGNYHALANLLDGSEAEIVELWIERVANIVVERSLDRSQLEDSIRWFIRHVGWRLRDGGPTRTPSAEEHGAQRFSIGFELAEMLEEYGALLDVVEHVAKQEKLPLEMGAYAALARNVVAGSAQAVLAFVNEEREQRTALARRHFAFLAHELRNPMQNLVLALRSWDAGVDPERLRGSIARAVEHLQRQIDHELVETHDAASISAPTPNNVVFDLVTLVDEVIELNRPFGTGRDIELTADTPTRLEVELDRGMVWSVLTNLVRNGIKFTKDGTVVSIIVRATDEDVRLVVRDGCGGLPDGTHEKIFRAFHQVGRDRSGFGLGLAIARQACEAHGGTISVADAPGGCEFVVTLPRVYAPDPAARRVEA